MGGGMRAQGDRRNTGSPIGWPGVYGRSAAHQSGRGPSGGVEKRAGLVQLDWNVIKSVFKVRRHMNALSGPAAAVVEECELQTACGH
jgi:hypothetical protein